MAVSSANIFGFADLSSNTRATVHKGMVWLADRQASASLVALDRLLSELRVPYRKPSARLPRFDGSYSRKQKSTFRWLLFTTWPSFRSRGIVGVVPMREARSVFGVFVVRRVARRWNMQGSVFEGILSSV
jgi:hypothetical protein